MEGGQSGLGNVVHPVDGPPADVQDQRNRDLINQFGVQVSKEVAIILAADQIAGRMIRQRQCVGACIDLGLPEGNRDLLHSLQAQLRVARIVKRHQQEWLDTAFQKRERILFVAQETNRTLAQAAIQFCLSEPNIAAVLPNIIRKDQLDEFAVASDTPPLTVDELTELYRLYDEEFSMLEEIQPQRA